MSLCCQMLCNRERDGRWVQMMPSEPWQGLGLPVPELCTTGIRSALHIDPEALSAQYCLQRRNGASKVQLQN
jgi:hypothetical protein